MKVLQVIQSAYRCSIEEQDDPAVWITHAMKGAGAELGVVLRGNAVNYAVSDQDATGLSLGGVEQKHAPDLAHDIASLATKGISVHVIAEDLNERGIDPRGLVPGVELVSRGSLAAMYGDFDQVWYW
jgi:intracellular sulfur oxidation DsrE/DsrF family protein